MDCDMKKKLLVLLIAVIPMLMPNLATAIEIEWDEDNGCIFSTEMSIWTWPDLGCNY